MKRFLWKESRSREGRGMVLVSWDVVCRPVYMGGGIGGAATTIYEPSDKVGGRHTTLEEDLASQVLMDTFSP